jgi:hypothetical protein
MKIYCIALHGDEDTSVWCHTDWHRDEYFRKFCSKANATAFEIEVAENERTRVIKALVELEAARYYALPQR